MSGKGGVREIGKTSKGGTQCSALARGFMLPLTAFFGRLVLGALRLGRMRLLAAAVGFLLLLALHLLLLAERLFIAHLPFAFLFGRGTAVGLRGVALQLGQELLLVPVSYTHLTLPTKVLV